MIIIFFSKSHDNVGYLEIELHNRKHKNVNTFPLHYFEREK